MEKKLLNDFFGSSTEFQAIDYFLESMAKTHTFDEKLEILKKQNTKYKAEIDKLKKQVKKGERFNSEKSSVNSTSLIKLDRDIIQNELSQGVWTDLETGLMWARISIGQEWKNEQCIGIAESLEWEKAEQKCHEIRLGDYSDWRLPEIDELKTLIRDSIQGYEGSMKILTRPKKNMDGTYWSNTLNGTYSGFVHTLSFDRGNTESHPYFAKAYARPVRSV